MTNYTQTQNVFVFVFVALHESTLNEVLDYFPFIIHEYLLLERNS
jgi:hypothetical protein